jgi:predicted DNA-binding WGR domain protein
MLPFFKYLGPGSRESVTMCKCGYAAVAHLPYWTAHIEVERNWYKCGRITQAMTKSFHASADNKEAQADREADFFRAQTHREESRVFRATVLDIVPAKSSMKCCTFTPIGPAEFDGFYCGCHGWD